MPAPGQNPGRASEKPKANANVAPPPAKWDDRVLDVFFPDARQALVGARPDYTAAAGGTLQPSAGDAAAAAGGAGESNASGSYAWSKLISAETLQDEIKSLGLLLADDVKTRQGFLGGGARKARQALSQLAAVFAIVNEYDGEVKWKSQAAAARDLFAKGGYNCKAATDNTFKEAKACSDNVAELLRGENLKPPSNLEPKNDWGKVADLTQLMSRLKTAEEDHIAPWTANAADMKKSAAALRHEAELVAALAEVISRPGFDNADDEKYHHFAKSLQQSAVALRDAVKKDDYAAANQAAGMLSKACANCHAAFRD